MMATVLTTRENFQYAALTQSVTTLDPSVRLAVAHLQAILRQQGEAVAAAHQMSLRLLYQQAYLDATVRGFDDTFFVGAMICIPAVLLARLVCNTRSEAGARPLAGAE
jgi:hypothetical protein